jgi:hypothetical protein
MTRLFDFFMREIETEARGDFLRLSQIPDSGLIGRLAYYRSLNAGERLSFRECCALSACAHYGFVVDAPPTDHTRHPFYQRWCSAGFSGYLYRDRSVPRLRSAVRQYKMDAHRGVPSRISEEEFRYASSIRAVKAPELRKRVRAALKALGYFKIDELGYYHCRTHDREFMVYVDFGGRSAQLRYCVAMPDFAEVHPLSQFCFERALGFGLGNWDYIVEENVDDAIATFAEVIGYCVELPRRIRAEVT